MQKLTARLISLLTEFRLRLTKRPTSVRIHGACRSFIKEEGNIQATFRQITMVSA